MKLIIEVTTKSDAEADLFFTGLREAVKGDPRLAGNFMVKALEEDSSVRVRIDGEIPIKWRKLP